MTTALASGGIAAAAGGAWWFLTDHGDPRGASSRIDLLAGAYRGLPRETDPEMLAMLSITGGMPKRTTFELRIFDLDLLPATADPAISCSLINLITGEVAKDIQIEAKPDGSWSLQQSEIQSDGWWQLKASIDGLTVSWTFLVPDPNLTGFGTPPTVETEPNAQAMLAASLNTLTRRTSLRWWEWLSGGNGAIILARFAVTTPESNELPAAFETDSIMAARIPLDGTPSSIRGENTRVVSTESESWKMVNGGTPEPTTTISYLPISQYDTTYAGFDGAHFGETAQIEGRDCQLIAFHLPGQIEAWFAFWVDIETLFLRELFMLSVNHYMHWVYYDYDEPFKLTI